MRWGRTLCDEDDDWTRCGVDWATTLDQSYIFMMIINNYFYLREFSVYFWISNVKCRSTQCVWFVWWRFYLFSLFLLFCSFEKYRSTRVIMEHFHQKAAMYLNCLEKWNVQTEKSTHVGHRKSEYSKCRHCQRPLVSLIVVIRHKPTVHCTWFASLMTRMKLSNSADNERRAKLKLRSSRCAVFLLPLNHWFAHEPVGWKVSKENVTGHLYAEAAFFR